MHIYSDSCAVLAGVLEAAGERYANYPLAGSLVLCGSLLMMFLDAGMRHWAHTSRRGHELESVRSYVTSGRHAHGCESRCAMLLMCITSFRRTEDAHHAASFQSPSSITFFGAPVPDSQPVQAER